MDRRIKWCAWSAGFYLALYAALILENVGFQRVVIFWVWLLLVGSICSATPTAIKKSRAKGRSVPRWLDVGLDIAAVMVLVYFGWWVTAIALFMNASVQAYIHDEE
jgi:hypothetical protein